MHRKHEKDRDRDVKLTYIMEKLEIVKLTYILEKLEIVKMTYILR
jgi:hypothetical protein